MKKALIIGIDKYSMAPLNGCINDATEIAKLLDKHEDGSNNFGVMLKKDVSSKGDLKKHIENLFDDKSEVALLYFSGHGVLSSTDGYIVARDYKRYDEGVSLSDIITLANKSKAKEKIIILDCCHSGELGNQNSDRKVLPITEGLTIMTACKDNQKAVEVDGHGVFTHLLISALQGGAANLLGNITASSVYSYIDQALGAWDQRPLFKTNVSSFSSLRRTEPLLEFKKLNFIATYFNHPEHHYQLAPSYESTEATANDEHVEVMKNMHLYVRAGLVEPLREDFLYYEAIKSGGCKLTNLGVHYWHMLTSGRL